MASPWLIAVAVLAVAPVANAVATELVHRGRRLRITSHHRLRQLHAAIQNDDLDEAMRLQVLTDVFKLHHKGAAGTFEDANWVDFTREDLGRADDVQDFGGLVKAEVGRQPDTLQTYCGSGDDPDAEAAGAEDGGGSAQCHLPIHTEVKANWKGYGKWYYARIGKLNKDGTYDLVYDDGFEELDVSCQRLRKLKGVDEKLASSDPVCKVSNVITELKSRINKAQTDISDYLQHNSQASERGIELVAGLGPPVFQTATQMQEEKDGKIQKDDEGNKEEMEKEEKAEEKNILEFSDALKQKYPEPEDAIKAMDVNSDGLVSEDEMADVLEQKLGMEPSHAEDVVVAVMDRYDPEGKGSIASSTLLNFLEEKNLVVAEAPAVAQAPAAVDAASPAAPKERGSESTIRAQDIIMMRMELGARTMELLERAEAIATVQFSYKEVVRELEELLTQDLALRSAPVPETHEGREKEMASLKAKIEKRARRLEKLLEEEEKLIAQANQTGGVIQEDVGGFLNDLGEEGATIEATVKLLDSKAKELKRAGILDPELRVQVNRVIDTATKMSSQMMDVSRMQNGFDDAVSSSVNATKEAATIQHLDSALKDQLINLDIEMRELRQDTDQFADNVVASDRKWWRYRWEYSYVEALICTLIGILCILWEAVHQYTRGYVLQRVQASPTFTLHSFFWQDLYISWYSIFFGELGVLLAAVLSLWFLQQVGFFKLWTNVMWNFMWTTNSTLHMPIKADVYLSLSLDIALQVCVAIIFFFGLCRINVEAALHTLKDCKTLEDSCNEEVEIEDIHSRTIGRFASGTEAYKQLKRYFLVKINIPKVKTRDFDQQDFMLWWFLGRKLKAGFESTFNVTVWTWVWLTISFASFAILHRFFHVSFGFIWLCSAIVSFAIYAYMVYVVENEVKVIHKSKFGDDVATSGAIAELNKDSDKLRKPVMVATFYQFPITILCYGAARMIFSLWMWRFYLRTTLAMALCIVGFVVVYVVYLAPTSVTYYLAKSFPPHLSGEEDEELGKRTLEEKERLKLEMKAQKDRVSKGEKPLTPRSMTGLPTLP